MAKADSGAVFMRRTPEDLAPWSDEALRRRAAFVTGHLSPDGGGLTYDRSATRRIAVAERRALLQEMARRGVTR